MCGGAWMGDLGLGVELDIASIWEVQINEGVKP